MNTLHTIRVGSTDALTHVPSHCVIATARAMLVALAAAAAILAFAHAAFADSDRIPELVPYRSATDILAATPSTDDGAIGALFNPAQWGVLEKPEAAFWWSDRNVRPNGLDSWGFSAGKGAGFSVRRTDARTTIGLRSVTDYQFGIGGGGRGDHFAGVAYGWSSGDQDLFDRKSFISLGSIHRPSRWASIGSTARFALGDDDIDGSIDAGIRPFGTPHLTLFADYAMARGDRWDDGSLAGGVAIQPIPGLAAAIKFDDYENVHLALGVTINREGFQAIPHYDKDGDLASTNYIVRANPPVRGADLDGVISKSRRVATLDMKGNIVYQKYRFGDDSSIALRGVTRALQFAIDDPTVGGVALNLSGLNANVEAAWEIREKLLRVKAAGKRVLIYGDDFGMTQYYLASVADEIVVDPQGGLLIPGLQLSRTYYKDALAKLGIAFDEWRFFEFKSAMESFSRTNMSDADRLQRQAIVDESYAEMANGIVATRRVTRTELDRIVDEEPVLFAKRLVELGLADRIGHWEDVDDIADTLTSRDVHLASAGKLRNMRWQPNEEWGAPPTIALVYAVGPCAMDEGINGRATSKAMKAFRERKDVAAVVLRADSPGGSPLPSDLIANEMLKLREAKKPILVSQGRVAASGGYWISMNADAIATSPFCITGSIGVIAGWFWNDGFGAKVGLTSDRVQAGHSADLLGGLRLPLLGATIPERNLDDGERAYMQKSILALYDDFTNAVAEARKLDNDYVRQIAEGRVYMGRTAIEKKIVDRIATLDETIDAAQEAAGIARGRRVRVVEYPEPGFFRFPTSGLPIGLAARALAAIGVDSAIAPALTAPRALSHEETALDAILRAPGQPLTLTPTGYFPDEPAPTR
ncbi:MAG: S49 family peptidase [bacterium]